MWEYLLVRYLHFIAIFALFALLVCQHILLKKEISLEQAKRLRTIDRFYGLIALLVLIMGFLLWFVVGKPAAFYSQNPIFHIKVTCFFVAGGISVVPTLFYGKAVRSGEQQVVVPSRIINMIRAQLLLLLLIPLFAVLMASGVSV